jgi:hypothetical protein
MTMSKDLFLSILAMDAYNRGYNPGIDLHSVGAGTSIGNATIDTTRDHADGQTCPVAAFRTSRRFTCAIIPGSLAFR